MGSTPAGTPGKPTAVIIDDSDELRALVRTRLRLSGLFDVVADGSTGAEALSLALQHQPALLLLDTSMPQLDGLEALPGILTLAPETRVVIFTGFEERGLADRARELGAADFIEKSYPIDRLPERLLAVVSDNPTPRRVDRPVLREVATGAGEADPDQQVLDEHLERFREVFEQATMGMATMTLNGTIVRANRAFADLMQCDPPDLVGVDYGRLTSGQGDVMDQCLKCIVGYGSDLETFEHDLAGWEPARRLRVTFAPIRDSKAEALYVFAQVQDVTAQRAMEDRLHQAEERFRLLISAVEEYAIFMLDTTGHIVSWNPGANRIKGYAAEEIVGQHFRVFYLPEQQAARHPEHELEIAMREGSYAEEGWRLRKDGSRFWASVVITSVYDDAGQHIGFAKVTRDQTERRQREDEREQAVQEQSRLLALAAHELRTPTAVIDGSAETLQSHWDDLSGKERERLLGNVRGSAHRVQRLITDLFTLARLETNTLRLRTEPTRSADILDDAVARARAAHPGVEVRISARTDVTVPADVERIGQAVDNLITNAIRHGVPPISVSTEHDDTHLLIKVTDAGPGVASHLVQFLFERFSEGARTSTSGTGLGLYLVREIARAHGGEATYESQDGAEDSAGTFVIRLPLKG